MTLQFIPKPCGEPDCYTITTGNSFIYTDILLSFLLFHFITLLDVGQVFRQELLQNCNSLLLVESLSRLNALWCLVAALGALKLSAEALLECYLYALTFNGVVSKTPERLRFIERFINILTVGEHSEKQATHTYLFFNFGMFVLYMQKSGRLSGLV